MCSDIYPPLVWAATASAFPSFLRMDVHAAFSHLNRYLEATLDGAADRAGCKAVVVSQSSVPTIRPTTTHQKGQLKVMHTDTRRSLQSRKARFSRQRCAQPAESPHAALCTSLTLHPPGNIEMESVRPLSGCLSPGDTGLIAF